MSEVTVNTNAGPCRSEGTTFRLYTVGKIIRAEIPQLNRSRESYKTPVLFSKRTALYQTVSHRTPLQQLDRTAGWKNCEFSG
jgi:hypothetical protein